MSQSRTSHLAITTFCWLPPDSSRESWWMDGVLTLSLSTISVAVASLAVRLRKLPHVR